MTVAQRIGGEESWLEFFGWTRDAAILADLYDALNMNTAATGQWKKKPPEFKDYPRPKVRRKTPVTVAELFEAWTGKVARDGDKGIVLNP